MTEPVASMERPSDFSTPPRPGAGGSGRNDGRGKDKGAGRAGCRKNEQTGLTTGFFFAIRQPSNRPNPQKRWETAIRVSRKLLSVRKFFQPPGRAESALDTGAASPGGMVGSGARRNLRVEPDEVRPSSPRGAEGGAKGGALDGGSDGGSDGRSAAAGRKAGRFPPVSSFASFGGFGRPLRAHFGR